MVSMANAALLISVNGVVDPPETEVTLIPSEHAVIDVHSDGTDRSDVYVYLTVIGAGVLDGTNGIAYEGTANEGGFGDRVIPIDSTILYFDLVIPGNPPEMIPEGIVVDYIDFHCLGEGDVTLLLGTDIGVGDWDTQVIHQVPEPMTIALLGLGGLFLRRRK